MAGNIGPWYKDNNAVKLVVIGALVLLFAVAEFAVGTITGSLALVADAFHMLAGTTLSILENLSPDKTLFL